MIRLSLDTQDKKAYQDIVSKATSILNDGGIIVYPTDTLYGIGANALNENAVLKVFKIKKQARTKPISVIAKDIAMVKKIACIDSKVEKILRKIWPGPITTILRRKDIVPYALTANTETIAVRIPLSRFVDALMKSINFPITATSANISGEKDLFSPTDITKTFCGKKNMPDIFIDNGKIKNPEPSTIIDLTSSTPKIVRIGIVGKEKMLELFNKFSILA